jgi:hypothetical protein
MTIVMDILQEGMAMAHVPLMILCVWLGETSDVDRFRNESNVWANMWRNKKPYMTRSFNCDGVFKELSSRY